ncbi:MAG TPA: RluA family pseudouridine synthase [Clostridia bacterium]
MEVIYEDNHILVVVKPQNVPVMADETQDKDMLTLCKEYIKEKENKPGNVYLGLVHRLDRPTGGVMVFAKTSKAASRISEAIRDGEVEKNYFAILLGTPKEKQGKLTHYLLKDEKTNTVKIVPMSTEGAKKAMLEYWIVGEYGKLSLARIKLITGRTHQIRVQMNSLHTPVLGDVKYGGESMPKGFNLALWAYELKFYHPVTKVKMVFRCYPPEAKVWEAFSPIIKSIIM